MARAGRHLRRAASSPSSTGCSTRWGPGHGKTVIVGYFLGRGGSIRRGLGHGEPGSPSAMSSAPSWWWACVHVALVNMLATPVEEILWLRLASYGAILLIGLVMLGDGAARPGHRAGMPSCWPRARCIRTTVTAHSLRGLREQKLLAVAAGFMPLLRRDPDPGLRFHQRHPADGHADDPVHRAGHGPDLGGAGDRQRASPITG